MMRSKTTNMARRLVIASPLIAGVAYDRNRSSLSLINETAEQIVFYALFVEEARRSIKARLRLFWPVMRDVYHLVQKLLCTQRMVLGCPTPV
jgi:hypothetical protein